MRARAAMLFFPVLGMLAFFPVACSRKPAIDVVLISMDTTRADRLGAYGHRGAHTPAIDSLARDGFLMRRHLTPVPVTLPSHSSLMTGLFPPSHGARDNGLFVVDQEPSTLAEVLSAAGYHTLAVVGAYPLAKRFGLDQGFEVYDDRLEERNWRERGLYFAERPAVRVLDAALEHLGKLDTSSPYFLFLHFFDPHQPQMPPSPWDRRFVGDPYDGEIAAVDEQIGRLLEYLEKRGTLDRTLIVLTADHGEGLGEHGELTHAVLLHQATLHIPLILKGPGVPQGETSEWTVSTEVFLTVLDLVGAKAPPGRFAPGSSLQPLLAAGGRAPEGFRRFEAYFETLSPQTSQGWAPLAAFMKNNWRYVNAPRPELFDLDADPREELDRSATEKQIATSLRAELVEKLKELEARPLGESLKTVDAEVVAQLAALGYLHADPTHLRRLDGVLAVEGLDDPKDRVVDISLYSEAKAATAAGRLPLAERLWRQLIDRSPNNAQAYAGLAVIFGQAGDWNRCFETLDAGLFVRPDSIELLRLKGELLIEVGGAQQGFDILSSLPVDSTRAATWLGVAHAQLGRPEEAEKLYLKGLEIEKDQQWLLLYLANSRASRKAYPEAEQTFLHLIEVAPYFYLAHFNYGLMMNELGRKDEAIAFFERARRLNPDHEPTRRALAELKGANS